jgi:hypothetical protein
MKTKTLIGLLTGLFFTSTGALGSLSLEVDRSTQLISDGLLELSTSSWAPQTMGVTTRSEVVSDFEQAGAPHLGMTYFFPHLDLGKEIGTLSLTLGGSYYRAKRTGTVSFGGVSQSDDQVVQIFFGKAGLAFRPSLLQWRRFSGELRGSVLPTSIQADSSIFSREENQFGVGYEAFAGTIIQLGSVAPNWMHNRYGFGRLHLSLGMNYIFGKAATSNLNNLAAQAGLGIAL